MITATQGKSSTMYLTILKHEQTDRPALVMICGTSTLHKHSSCHSGISILYGLQRPPFALLGPIKVNNGVVEFLQGRPMSDGQHSDASLHASFI